MEPARSEEMRRLIFWLLTLVSLFGGCATFNPNPIPGEYASIAPPENTLNSAAALAAGRDIFMANCAACHGIQGNGHGTTQPTFGPQPVDFTDGAHMASLSPQYLFWRVSEGGRVEPYRSQGSIMPAWKYLLDGDMRWQVIAYVRTLAR